jgi:replicative DNA helicase
MSKKTPAGDSKAVRPQDTPAKPAQAADGPGPAAPPAPPQPPALLSDAVLAGLAAVAKGNPPQPMLLTGLADLDELTGGFGAGELVVVAGRPGVGRSAFVLSLLRHVAVEAERPVFIVALQSKREDIADRLLCCEASIDHQRYRQGKLAAGDRERLAEAGRRLAAATVHVDDTARQGVSRIAAAAAGLKADKGLGLVVIDAIGQVNPERHCEARHEAVAVVVRELKALAKELRVPVLLVAGVNRAVADRQDRSPRLHDLSETAALEEVADIVLLVHAPDRNEPGQHAGILELIVAKRRGGPVGEVTVAHIKQYARVQNYTVGSQFDD